MAEFGFTEAQEMLRREVRDFAQRELASGALERSKMQPMELHQALRDIDKKCVELGWNSLNVPAKYGGQQIDTVSLGIIVEEVAKVDPTVEPVGLMQATSTVLETLPEDIQDEWFPPLIRRERRHFFGFTEAEAGSDAAGIVTRAVRDGHDYIISGEKTPLPGAVIADAVTISTKTDPAAGFRGVSLFWIPLNLPGVIVSPLPWMGNPGLYPSVVMFDDVRVPARYLEGEEGKGFYMLMGTLDWLRVVVAFECLGRAQASLADAIDWSKQRQAFGKAIAGFQGVSFPIVEHYTRIEAARLLCYKTLWLRDQGQIHTKESCMAKWFSVRVSLNAINDCMLILGHPSYSTEHPIQQRMRDVIGYQFGDGTEQIHKIIISRFLIGKEATR